MCMYALHRLQKYHLLLLHTRFSTIFIEEAKTSEKNEGEAIMQNTFHVVKVDQVLRKENAAQCAGRGT